MERMLVVVFSDQGKAYEATQALSQLDDEDSITVHAQAVMAENSDKTTTVKQVDGDFPIRTLGGTAIGALLGVLGGPVGAGLGAMAGATAGSFGDLYAAGVDTDFLQEARSHLKPGMYAVAADISEEWQTPVDTRMKALQGTVFRSARLNFEQEQRAAEISQLRAEVEQLKAEHAGAKVERKADLQARLNGLREKLETKQERARQRSAQIKSETDAKIQALQKKAAKAQGDLKATINARAKQIQQEYEQGTAGLKSFAA